MLGVIVALTPPVRAQDASAEDDVLSEIGLAAFVFVSEEFIDELASENPFFDVFVSPVLADAGLYNPFKGDVTYSETQADTANISHTFAAVINATAMDLELAYTTDRLVGAVPGAGTGTPGSNVLPPINPSGPPKSFEEVLLDALVEVPVDLSDVDDDFDTDRELEAALRLLRDPAAPSRGPLEDSVFIFGVRTVSPRALDCRGSLRDSGVFFDTPIVNWDDSTGANSAAFNDFFYAGDVASVVNCPDAEAPVPPIIRTFQGPGSSPAFADSTSNGAVLIGPFGWVQIIDGADVPGATAVRWFEFITDVMAPFNPDYTAASAYPANLELLQPLSMTPHLFFDTSLLAPPTTTTTSTAPTTTTTLAAVTPVASGDTTTTSQAVALGPTEDGGEFPFPILIVFGAGIMGVGVYLWWDGSRKDEALPVGGAVATAPAPSTSTVVTAPPPTDEITTRDKPTVVAGRPGKGVGSSGPDAPPKIGLRGWKL